MVIPFNILMIARQEFVSGVDRLEKPADKFSNRCVDLRSSLGGYRYGGHVVNLSVVVAKC